MQKDRTPPRPRPVSNNHSSNSIHPLLERQSIKVNLKEPVPSPPPAAGVPLAPHILKRRQEAERAALRQKMRLDIQRQQNELRKHKEFIEKTKIWEEQILPHWDALGHTNRVRDLCLKGIPPTIRAKVWPLLVGNELEVDEELFDALNREIQDSLGDKLTAHRAKKLSFVGSLDRPGPAGPLDPVPVGGCTPPMLNPRPPPVMDPSEHTGDIPIPQDITEQEWFENERAGSLDGATFDMVQRQLMDRPNYLLQRMFKSPMVKKLSAQSMDSDQVDSPMGTAEQMQFAFDDEPIPKTPDRPAHLNEVAFTPPRREKHSADYLISAGLLVEDADTSLVISSPPSPVMPMPLEEDRADSLWCNRNGSSELTHQLSSLSPEPEEFEEEVPQELAKLLTAVSLIEWDLPRTFPTLAFFHDGGPMHTGMERILLCYSLYKPSIGYVQGMSFLVATLLLCMDEFEAFKCFSNLLNRRISRDFFCLRKESIDAYVRCFDYYFKKLLPLLFNHLRAEGVTSEMFLMDWNLSLFTKTLPLEIAAQVWDGYLYEGEAYILSVGLGILKMYAAMLSTYTFERISPFLLHLPEDIKADDLFNNVAQINISKKHYEKIRRRMVGDKDDDSPSHAAHPPGLLTKLTHLIAPTPSPAQPTAPAASAASAGSMRRSKSAQHLPLPLQRTASRRGESIDLGVSQSRSYDDAPLLGSILLAQEQPGTETAQGQDQAHEQQAESRPVSHDTRGSRGSAGSRGSREKLPTVPEEVPKPSKVRSNSIGGSPARSASKEAAEAKAQRRRSQPALPSSKSKGDCVVS